MAPALLARLRLPLLLIWGRSDQLVPLRVARQVRQLRSDLPLEVVEHCGHCPHDEHPRVFNALICAWLGQFPGPDT